MKNLITFLMVIVLTSCVGVQGETEQQKLFGLIGDYSRLQKIGIEYKKECAIRPENRKNHCEDHVVVIQNYNNKANNLIQAISVGEDGVKYTETIGKALNIIIVELSTYLIKIGEIEQ